MTDETDCDKCQRILIVDDNPAIHEDIRKVLCPQRVDDAFLDADLMIFGDLPNPGFIETKYQLDSVLQGQEALRSVAIAFAQERPYSVAIVDMRMPPGWDGLQTIQRMWQIDPRILVIISTAYSDYTWEEMVQALGMTDQFVLLKKPFDNAELQQLVAAMVERWHVARMAEINVAELSWLARQNEMLLAKIDDLTCQIKRLEGLCVEPSGTVNGRFLIVDHNSVDRVNTEFTVRDHGLIPVGVSSIDDAILELEDGAPFNGIIVETSCPGNAAFEIPKKLANSGFKGPIIAYTHHERPGDRQACLAHGFTDWIPKSSGSEELVRAISRWLITSGQSLASA